MNVTTEVQAKDIPLGATVYVAPDKSMMKTNGTPNTPGNVVFVWLQNGQIEETAGTTTLQMLALKAVPAAL